MKFDYKELIDEVHSKNFWPRLLIMIFGVFLLAITYNMFFLEYDLVTGGTSGLAIIINHLFDIDPALFIFIIEIFLLILSFILLGTKRTGMTILGSLLFPFFISLTSNICSFIADKVVYDSYIIITLVSGLLFGIGSGLVYKMGYSTGGADIVMQILNKYMKISTGTASFITSIAVVVPGAFVFGINKAIYGTIIIVIISILVDKIMLGISNSKMFYIRTKKVEEVQDFIKEMNTGYTIIKADGAYSKKKYDMIMCVLPTRDYYMFKNVIQKIDPDAFFIITDCYEVYGGQRKEINPFI
jgi:uncharacterized membrane-anchored protein YitT (DUF2179 family)